MRLTTVGVHWRSLAIVVAASLLLGCGTTGRYVLLGTAALGTIGTIAAASSDTKHIQQPSHPIYPSRAFVTEEIFKSMIYLARTDSGVIVIDLGWQGADDLLLRNLNKLRYRTNPTDPMTVRRASADNIHLVFLTHSHHDHIQGWRTVSQRRGKFGWRVDTAFRKPIYVAQPESVYAVTEAEFKGPVPRIADHIATGLAHAKLKTRWGDWHYLMRPRRPRVGEIRVRTFAKDTCFVFGRDTMFALTVPGHTLGSAAYVFRRVLFTGDALTTGTPLFLIPMPDKAPFNLGRMRRGTWSYTDNISLNRESVRALRDKVSRLHPEVRPEWGCIAHALCERMYTPREWTHFWEKAVDGMPIPQEARHDLTSVALGCAAVTNKEGI